jgi:hypothetical protein
MLAMPASRGRKSKPKIQTHQTSHRKEARWQAIGKRFLSPWGFVVGAIGLVASLIVFWETYIQTLPEIHIRDADPTSSYVLPFVVVNKSQFFDMNNVTLKCVIEMVFFEDEEKHKFGEGGVVLDADVLVKQIPTSSQVNYPCEASGVLRAQSDGAVALGSLMTAPGAVHSKLTVSTMCVWISVTYETLGFKRKYRSHNFGWLITPSGHRWLEGPMAQGMTRDYLCPGDKAEVYTRLHGTGDQPTIEFNP